jgi:hypothetical protein
MFRTSRASFAPTGCTRTGSRRQCLVIRPLNPLELLSTTVGIGVVLLDQSVCAIKPDCRDALISIVRGSESCGRHNVWLAVTPT